MITIAKESLRDMYNNNSNKEVCKKLKVTNSTLISLLKRYDIKTKGKGNRNSKYKIIVVN